MVDWSMGFGAYLGSSGHKSICGICANVVTIRREHECWKYLYGEVSDSKQCPRCFARICRRLM